MQANSSKDEIKLLTLQVARLISELHKATEDAVTDATTIPLIRKALVVESYALVNAIQTISFAIDTLRDERLLAIWQHPNAKRN
jgi:hypothetical protein